MSKKLFLIGSPGITKADGQIIRNEDAIKMIQLYQFNYGGDAHKTFAVNFSIDDLSEIKKLLAATKATGFSLYYGMYPKDDSLNPPGKDYSERQTVIVVPTINGKPVVDINQKYDPSKAEAGSAYDHGELNP
jgi:hypothetical protein